MFSESDSKYNLDSHLISFLQDAPFFAELSRHIRKVQTRDIPTAGVGFDQQYDDITLYWNPEFFESLTNDETRGVLLHEFYHLVFGHLTARRKSPPKMWNVATDLAINSIIVSSVAAGMTKNALPSGALIPGIFPVPPSDRKYTKEEKAAMPIAALIESFPHAQASEWYFEKLKEKASSGAQQRGSCPVHKPECKEPGDPQINQDNPGTDNSDKNKPDSSGGVNEGDCTCGDSWIGSMDDHSGWEVIPEHLRESVANRVSNIVEKAVRHADSQANGWGNVPAVLRESIRKSVSKIVDWRQVLRQFVGSLARGNKTSSIKRINRRYPYIHPGSKRAYAAKLLVAIDQSGSVSDQMLALFFVELAQLTKRVSVTILPFDCAASGEDITEWRRGTNPVMGRVKGGGTDFNAPTAFVNDPKNRGKWDGMLILTDGECGAPISSRIKRGWVLGPGCKLPFATNEISISLDPNPQKAGAWH